jgi:hypothetical protein
MVKQLNLRITDKEFEFLEKVMRDEGFGSPTGVGKMALREWIILKKAGIDVSDFIVGDKRRIAEAKGVKLG